MDPSAGRVNPVSSVIARHGSKRYFVTRRVRIGVSYSRVSRNLNGSSSGSVSGSSPLPSSEIRKVSGSAPSRSIAVPSLYRGGAPSRAVITSALRECRTPVDPVHFSASWSIARKPGGWPGTEITSRAPASSVAGR